MAGRIRAAQLRLDRYCCEGRTAALPAIEGAPEPSLACAGTTPLEPHDELALLSFEHSPEEIARAEEQLAQLMRTLDSANARSREVFFLHRLVGLSYPQIAQRLGLAVSAVERDIAIALMVLAGCSQAVAADALSEENQNAIDDAAAWLARLHGPCPTPALERGLQQWLHASAVHARAFEDVAAAWGEVGKLRGVASIEVSMAGVQRPRGARRPSVLLAGAAILILVTVLCDLLNRQHESTGVGEQRTLLLEDGTRVYLNTATDLRVGYEPGSRSVILHTGEALFEVAKDGQRPFQVRVAGREIQALGTVFLVRHDAPRLAVTVLQGNVSISQVGSNASPALLAAGDRETFQEAQSTARLDHPDISELLAWQRGKVMLHEVALEQAAMEMNRYSNLPVRVANAQTRQLLVSGTFRIGDSLGFAREVAQRYGLGVHRQPKAILIDPAAAPGS